MNENYVDKESLMNTMGSVENLMNKIEKSQPSRRRKIYVKNLFRRMKSFLSSLKRW